MTNTKFRKRALLSSVAMLLVALVALGSATFAWFTDKPTATATGITAKGMTSKGLTIKTDTDPTPTDNHNAEFFKNVTANSFIMEPAYLKDVTTALTTKAKTANAYGLADNATWAQSTIYDMSQANTTPGTGVYKESAYIRTQQAGDNVSTPVYLDKVTINTTTHAMANAVCVAVFNSSGTLLGTWKKGSDAIKGYETTPTLNAAVGAEDSDNNVTPLVNEAALTTSVGNASDNADLKVTFVVYLDGSDQTVFTNAASADQIITSIKAEFSVHTS